MENRGRQRKIQQFYNNRGKNVYENAYKQKRAASPRPSNAFRRTQNTINAARPLQYRKSIFRRAPSPTRNGARQRENNINRTIKNIDRYNNLTGKSNNLHNTSYSQYHFHIRNPNSFYKYILTIHIVWQEL